MQPSHLQPFAILNFSLVAMLAIPFAIVIYEVAQGQLWNFTGQMGGNFGSSVSNSIWNYPFLLKYLFSAAILTGLFSGLYPALFLSSVPTIQVLTGRFRARTKMGRGRKIMIVFQFSMALVFIVSASILYRQFDGISSTDRGFNTDNISAVSLANLDTNQVRLISDDLVSLAAVQSVSTSQGIPGIWEATEPAHPAEEDGINSRSIHSYGVGREFLSVMDMRLTKGRGFDLDNESGFVINEAASRFFEWEYPVGQMLTVGETTEPVIGVVEDFLFADIIDETPPAVLYVESDNPNFLMIRFTTSAKSASLAAIVKDRWDTVIPEAAFEYTTLDDYFAQFLGILGLLAGLINQIGIVAMLLSCLGLLGLVSYTVGRKTKEIGIRKALGASNGIILPD